MVNESFIHKLKEIVGNSNVSLTDTGKELYSYDASLIKSKPSIVIFPGDTEEVSRVVKAANEAGVAFLPRGFGTNLSGGTISVTEGLVICLSRFNRILGIYPDSRYALVQPGVTNLEMQQECGKYNCFYAPDPASQKVSTLGGNAGENSGGPLCLKYGVTSNHIIGMEMVMGNGEIVKVGGPQLDAVPGFDLRGLIVGSEGSFGIITELILRILPKTETVITMLAVYDEIPPAAQTVAAIIAAGIVPNTLEMMDATVIEAVEDSGPCGYPRDAAAVLIIEVEGMKVGLQEQADRIREICMDTGCRDVRVAKNQEERDRLWQGRRGAFGAIARLAPNYLVNDACVPRTMLPQALERVKEISDQYNFRCGNVFHAGDGNLHPLLMFDSRNPDDLKRVHKAGWAIMQACVELGGTITGEHGVGREKQEGMRMVFSGDDLNTQKAVKLALDPGNKLNPEKIIPLPENPGEPLESFEATVLKRPGGKTAQGVAKAMEAIEKKVAAGQPVTAMGGGIFKNYGNTCTVPVEPFKTEGMIQIIEHDQANQFITAGAGVALDELQKVLDEKNQWLPIRPPFFTDKSTTGALASMDVSGPERMLYGAPRDFLLGLQYIDSKGKLISTGGKVVKNVAGFDMTRLLTGSNGTLGIITEGTWRVITKPECCTMISGTGTLALCAAAAMKLMKSNLFPAFACGVLRSGTSSASGQWELVTGFEGIDKVVAHQTDVCCKMLEQAGLVVEQPSAYALPDGCFKEVFEAMNQPEFIVKIAGKTAGMEQTAKEIDSMGDLVPSQWLLDFGCGKMLIGTDKVTSGDWAKISQKNKFHGSHIQMEKAPENFRKDHDVYGTLPRQEWALMHNLKKALDPQGIFAPGRMPGRV